MYIKLAIKCNKDMNNIRAASADSLLAKMLLGTNHLSDVTTNDAKHLVSFAVIPVASIAKTNSSKKHLMQVTIPDLGIQTL